MYERVQFETIVASPGRRMDEPQPFRDARQLPSGKIRCRATTPSSEAREADHIGFLRGEGEESPTVTPHEQGRMRTLDGQRVGLVAGNVIVLPSKCDRRAGERPLDAWSG